MHLQVPILNGYAQFATLALQADRFEFYARLESAKVLAMLLAFFYKTKKHFAKAAASVLGKYLNLFL